MAFLFSGFSTRGEGGLSIHEFLLVGVGSVEVDVELCSMPTRS